MSETQGASQTGRSRTLVARFDNMEAARIALDDLSEQHDGVKRGSLLLRDLSGSVYVRELDERSLREIARGGIELGTFFVAGGLGIALEAIMSSVNLLARSTGRAARLAGSVVKAPFQKVQGIFLRDPDLKDIGESLDPGASAIVLDVEPDKATEVAARMVAHGGAIDVTVN